MGKQRIRNLHKLQLQHPDNQASHSDLTPRLNRGVWTSSRIETQQSDFAASAGGQLYIESRIKLGDAPTKSQQGIWPAFWALASNFKPSHTNWPAVSEWDILESVNNGIGILRYTVVRRREGRVMRPMGLDREGCRSREVCGIRLGLWLIGV
jgi:hypothetical protein